MGGVAVAGGLATCVSVEQDVDELDCVKPGEGYTSNLGFSFKSQTVKEPKKSAHCRGHMHRVGLKRETV